MKSAVLTVITLLFFTGAGLAPASILVLPDGTGDYPDIQTALLAAADGDTIELFNGVYSGPGNRNLDFASDVVLKSRSGYTQCVIDCEGLGRAFNLTEETGGWIRGITVRGGLAAEGGVAVSGWGTYVFHECLFLDNQATDKGGVWYGTDGGDIYFWDCVFSNNSCAGRGGCLMAEGATEVLIQRCSFVRNEAAAGAGLYLGSDAVGHIYNSIMAFNLGGAAFDGYYFASLDVGCSNLYRNVGGDYVNGASGLGTEGNISEDPRWMDPMAELPDVRLTLHSPCRAAEAVCGITMGAASEIANSTPRYGINPEGTGMFARIKDAFAPSGGLEDNAVVILEDGTYPGVDSDYLTLDGVSLVSRSGNPEACVLDFLGTPNTTILRSFNDDVPVLVKGITLANTSQTSYGFMHISGGLSVIVADCIFCNHYLADTDDPPFRIWSTDYVEFRNCLFQDIIVDSPLPLFQIGGLASDLCYINECEFRGTQASGLLIQAEDQDFRMYGTDVHDNTASGLLHSHNNQVDLEETTFTANTTVGAPLIQVEQVDLDLSGGGVTGNTSDDNIVEIYRSTGRIEEAEFSGNYSDKINGAGALNLNMSEMTIQDCLFEGNVADGGAGAIFAQFNESWITLEAALNITGCTFRGNDAFARPGALFVTANGVETTYSGNYQHVTLNLQSSTFDGNLMSAVFSPQIAIQSSLENGPITPTGWIEFHMERCLITNGDTGGAISADLNPASSTAIHCTNIHGNDGGDWDDPWLQAHFASLGNISEAPLYCDAAAGDLTLQSTSPCLPLNNLCNVQIGAFGEGCSGASAVEDTPLAGRTGITGNHPNPFNPRTVIRFNLAESGPVSVLVYDMSGRLVRILIQDEVLAAGPQEVLWDGCDAQGRPAAAGIYLARLGAGGQISTRKMIMIK